MRVFAKEVLFIVCIKKVSIGYKWLELNLKCKKFRNICHRRLSFHLEGKINEISPNSREELFTKQAIIQTLLSTIYQQKLFCTTGKMEWNNFGAKFSLQIIFMDFPNPCFCNFELGEVYLNLLRIKFKHCISAAAKVYLNPTYPGFFQNTHRYNIYHCSLHRSVIIKHMKTLESEIME